MRPCSRVVCSKGTYVRTLCHDIGQALGCGGCMSSLRRTRAAGFSLEDAVPLAQVLESERPDGLLRTVDTYFTSFPSLSLSPVQAKKVRNGAATALPGVSPAPIASMVRKGTSWPSAGSRAAD